MKKLHHLFTLFLPAGGFSFLGTVGSVLGIASAAKNLLGGGGDSGGGSTIKASTKAADMQAAIAKEQWDLFMKEGLPRLRKLAGLADSVTDRTPERTAAAVNDVRTQYAVGRRNADRALTRTRNPADPGYAAALAATYGAEASDVAGAITREREAERARVEDTTWDRNLQVAQAYQGFPQQAGLNLQGAAATYSRAGTAMSQMQALDAARRSQGAYGGVALARNAKKWFGGGNSTAGSDSPGAINSDYAGLYDGYDPYEGMPDTYGLEGGDYIPDNYGLYADGGAIRRRRYADGGEVEGGGPIKGPGTGTSDSVATRKRPGTYILSADTVRATGHQKLEQMMEKAGVRKGYGADADPGGANVRLSNGEWAMPPEVVQFYGEEFFNKLQQKYHRPVAGEPGAMANGGAIRGRSLPASVERAIFGAMPHTAIGRSRRHA